MGQKKSLTVRGVAVEAGVDIVAAELRPLSPLSMPPFICFFLSCSSTNALFISAVTEPDSELESEVDRVTWSCLLSSEMEVWGEEEAVPQLESPEEPREERCWYWYWSAEVECGGTPLLAGGTLASYITDVLRGSCAAWLTGVM